MLAIELQGEKMGLLAERGLWWPAQKTLIVADLHWGKSAHFRKAGIPIPGDTQQHDELKLAGLIREHGAEQLIIAGDLFHSKNNKEVEGFARWRTAHEQLHISLVTGNHDKFPIARYEAWGMEVHTKFREVKPFCIAHDEFEDATHFTIHGHVHPAIRLSGKGRQAAMKLCCFCEDEHRIILPAFGQFTGNHLQHAADHKHVYVIAEDKVIRWK